MSASLFRKWRGWLDRIYSDQLADLLVNQHIFRQLAECTQRYVGTRHSADLAYWMKQGYIAFAATAVRRMLDEPMKPLKPVRCEKCGHVMKRPKPNDSVSLVALLRDLQQHAGLFTREWYRKRYLKRTVKESWQVDKLTTFADRDFGVITGRRGLQSLSADRIKQHIDTLVKVARPVRRLVNKAIAHTDADRRRIGRPKFNQLDAAIEVLASTFERYSLLIRGSCLSPLVDFDAYNVKGDLLKIWP